MDFGQGEKDGMSGPAWRYRGGKFPLLSYWRSVFHSAALQGTPIPTWLVVERWVAYDLLHYLSSLLLGGWQGGSIAAPGDSALPQTLKKISVLFTPPDVLPTHQGLGEGTQ